MRCKKTDSFEARKTNSDPDGSKHQNGQLVTTPGDNKIADGWKCGATATGKFCPEYRDIFDENDRQ